MPLEIFNQPKCFAINKIQNTLIDFKFLLTLGISHVGAFPPIIEILAEFSCRDNSTLLKKIKSGWIQRFRDFGPYPTKDRKDAPGS